MRGVRQGPWMFLFTWSLCNPTAKNPKSMPLSIFRLTLHELPEWSTPWTDVFSVRFVSKCHLFLAGHKSGTRAEGLMLWAGWALSWNNQNYSLLMRVKLPHGNQSVVQGWGVFLVKVESEDRKWSVPEKSSFPKFLSSLCWSELCSKDHWLYGDKPLSCTSCTWRWNWCFSDCSLLQSVQLRWLIPKNCGCSSGL